jgi:hypothetical protein
MTIYGTPGSTPANTSGFQGTAPGNPVGALQVGAFPGAVGMVVPNGDNRGPATLLSQQSNGSIASNTRTTGAGNVAAGGRELIETQGRGGEVGSQTQAFGVDTLNSDSNGGAGPGAGQANQTEGPSSGQSSQVATLTPASSVTVQSPAGFGG